MHIMTIASNTDRIVKSIDIHAGIDRVWRALTDHEEFGSWFQVKLDGPFIVGTHSSGHITYPGFEQEPWGILYQRNESSNLFRLHMASLRHRPEHRLFQGTADAGGIQTGACRSRNAADGRRKRFRRLACRTPTAGVENERRWLGGAGWQYQKTRRKCMTGQR